LTPQYTIFSLGDQALSFQFDGETIDREVHALLCRMKTWINDNPFPGLLDVIVGYASISLRYDAFTLISQERCESAATYVKNYLGVAYENTKSLNSKPSGKHFDIPVCYNDIFGLDLQFVAERNNLDVDEIIKLHTSVTYSVYLIGFLPGFPYLGLVDPKLEVPRKSSPRPRVHAGSIGVAGKQTGIYPFDSPGGWQIIGRTPLNIFDSVQNPPALLEAGDTVSFYAIDEKEFVKIEKSQP
jgi:inhibitor of KinA